MSTSYPNEIEPEDVVPAHGYVAEPVLHPAAPPQETSPETQPWERDIIDLRFLFASLWRGKWWILLALIAGAAAGWYTLSKHQDFYRAEMAIAVSAGGDFSFTPSSNSGLSGLAEGLGLKVGGVTQAGPFDRLRLHVGSTQFATLLQEKYGLLQKIWANQWDAEKKSWKEPSGSYFEFKQKLLRWFRLETWTPPDIELLARHLGSGIVIEEHEDLPFMMMSYKSLDPDLALDVLNIVHQEADNLVREVERRQSEERKQYIAGRLQTASQPEMRQVLIALLENEEREAISLEGDFTYSGDVVVAPSVGSKPLEPDLIILFGLPIFAAVFAMCGLIVLIALIRYE